MFAPPARHTTTMKKHDVHPAAHAACRALGIDVAALRSQRLAAVDAKSIATAILVERDIGHDEVHRRLGLHAHRGMVSYHARRHQDRLDTSTPYREAYEHARELYESSRTSPGATETA